MELALDFQSPGDRTERMLFTAAIQQSSLFDTPQKSAIDSATSWVVNLLSGTLAIAVAVIAIAWVGFAMLSGRVDVRRGLTVVLGCFILFGARAIVDGLRTLASSEDVRPTSSTPSPRRLQTVAPPATKANAFDPYAGAPEVPPNE